MNQPTTNEILNRLLVIHNRSLPMYLNSATPWWGERDARARDVLAQIVADQQHMVDRIGALILEHGGSIEYGEFPIRFTAYHDIAGDYLLAKMIDYQQRTIAAIEKCAAQLADEPRAHALAQQALGMARAHLDMLKELAEQTVQSTN